jgi:hypothetical protein
MDDLSVEEKKGALTLINLIAATPGCERHHENTYTKTHIVSDAVAWASMTIEMKTQFKTEVLVCTVNPSAGNFPVVVVRESAKQAYLRAGGNLFHKLLVSDELVDEYEKATTREAARARIALLVHAFERDIKTRLICRPCHVRETIRDREKQKAIRAAGGKPPEKVHSELERKLLEPPTRQSNPRKRRREAKSGDETGGGPDDAGEDAYTTNEQVKHERDKLAGPGGKVTARIAGCSRS